MNSFLLLVGGSTLTLALYIMATSEARSTEPQGLGDSLRRWGRRERLSATGTKLKGSVEHGLGQASGSSLVSGKGLLDEATGALKETAGKLAEAVGEAMRPSQTTR